MNPYERILASTKKKPAPVQPKEKESTVLSRVQKRRQIPKPRFRLSVEFRFKFDLPEPPMDLMMLNGTMSPDAFANAQSIPIERLARPPALPSDPRYGLCGNLLDPSIYQKPMKLTIDDEALLLNIEVESKTPISIGGSSSRTEKGVDGLPTRRRAVAPAPWMRRMSYDEYFGRQNTQPQQSSVAGPSVNGLVALQGSKPRRTTMPAKPRQTLDRTFLLARKVPVHPKKRTLKPVKITPLFPDFSTLGEEFISIQFDSNMSTTHREREKDPEMHKKATMHMATISLAGESDKKFLASYTPSNDALEQLTDENEDTADKTLVYDWVAEYGIRDPSKFSLTGARKSASRAIYALRKHESADGKKRVATLSRVSVSWKLQPRHNNLPRLGKPNMKVHMVPRTQADEDDKLDRLVALFSRK